MRPITSLAFNYAPKPSQILWANKNLIPHQWRRHTSRGRGWRHNGSARRSNMGMCDDDAMGVWWLPARNLQQLQARNNTLSPAAGRNFISRSR